VTTYTPTQIYGALVNAGVPSNDATTLTAISGAESGFGASQVSGVNTNGTTDYGVFQINSVHSDLNPASLPNADLQTQANAAASVYNSQGLSAWSTYNSGAYQTYMGQAQQGALASQGGASFTGAPADQSDSPYTQDELDQQSLGSNQAGAPGFSNSSAGGNTAAIAEASTPGYLPDVDEGGPFAFGITTGLAAGIGGWLGTAETAVGNAFRAATGAVLGTVGNVALRGFLIVIGIVILLVALWRLSDPDGTKTAAIARSMVKTA
jgi:Lysozyme like domain